MQAGNRIYLGPNIVRGIQPIYTELNNMRIKEAMCLEKAMYIRRYSPHVIMQTLTNGELNYLLLPLEGDSFDLSIISFHVNK